MDIQTAIKTRRSVRKFLPDLLPEADITAIIEAGQMAPSSRNTQARFFAAFTGQQPIAALLEQARLATARLPESRYTDVILNPAYTLNYGAPLFIMVLANPAETSSPHLDCACALQNMLLAAHGHGIASCWINQLCFVHEDEEFRNFMGRVGIPEGYACYCSGAFGRHAGSYPAPPSLRPGTSCIINHTG